MYDNINKSMLNLLLFRHHWEYTAPGRAPRIVLRAWKLWLRCWYGLEKADPSLASHRRGRRRRLATLCWEVARRCNPYRRTRHRTWTEYPVAMSH